MSILAMSAIDLAGKRVMIREDFNVPITAGTVSSDLRLRAALPTIELARRQNARVLLISHLGRPREGQFSSEDSLQPVAVRLGELLGCEVKLIRDWLGGVEIAPGQVALAENVRMNVGEAADDSALAARYAALCDVFVMDAFGTAHRAQASTHAVIKLAKVACAGPLLVAELDALGRALDHPKRPMLSIVGGSKVSTKLSLLATLSSKVDQLIVGGGIANTFIAAAGYAIGTSLHEPDLIEEARRLIETAKAQGREIPIPQDVIVASAFAANAQARVCAVDQVAANEMILDIGPATQADYARRIAQAGTVVWNGPVGVFEFAAFASGTRAVAQAIAGSSAFSIAGGGDTLAAIDLFGVAAQIDYISTGGGAFLEFLEGRQLPSIAALEARG